MTGPEQPEVRPELTSVGEMMWCKYCYADQPTVVVREEVPLRGRVMVTEQVRCGECGSGLTPATEVGSGS